MLYNLSGSVEGRERWYRSNKMLRQLKNAMEYNKPRTPLSDIFPLPSSAANMCHDIGYSKDDTLPPSDIDCGFAQLILSIVGLSQVQDEEQDLMAMEDFAMIKADEDKYVHALY